MFATMAAPVNNPNTVLAVTAWLSSAPKRVAVSAAAAHALSATQNSTACISAHIDCDAFYAAIEKRDNPALKDRPVIVGGGRRGVVSTAC